MATYVITDSNDHVIRVETSAALPPVVNGEFVEVTNEIFPGWPTIQGKVLTYTGGEFLVVDTRSVPELKIAKNAEINAARLAANQSSFTFSGKEIACDPLSRSDIDGVNGIVSLTGSLPPSFPGAWKAIDNTYVAIPDVPTWIAFYGSMVAKGVINFNHAQDLKAALALADTPEEIDVIIW